MELLELPKLNNIIGNFENIRNTMLISDGQQHSLPSHGTDTHMPELTFSFSKHESQLSGVSETM